MPMGGIDSFVQEAMNRPHTTQPGGRGRGEKKKDGKDTKKGGRGNKKDSSNREAKTAALPGARDQ